MACIEALHLDMMRVAMEVEPTIVATLEYVGQKEEEVEESKCKF